MERNLNDEQKVALGFLVRRLNENNIPYLIIGGLAAIAWGVDRKLVDIDVQVPMSEMKKVGKIFKAYIVTDIRNYKTENWDIVQMILEIGGVTIDICQAEHFVCIKGSRQYELPNSIVNAALFRFEGYQLPVLPKPILIEYKSFINRPIDRVDLESLS